MLLAERVLAHEYLSHLVPPNAALGRAVTEQWLVALLQDLYQEKAGEHYWPGVLFPALRQDLGDHVAKMETAKNPLLEPVRSMGITGIETAASDLLANAPGPYWRFTEELLTLPAEQNVEEVLVDLMGYFAVAGTANVELALSRKYKNIKDLNEWLGLGKR